MTLEEAREFAEAINTSQFDDKLLEAMEKDADINLLQTATGKGKLNDWQWIEERMRTGYTIKPVHRVHLLRTAWFRVAVAILIIAGIGSYLWLKSPDKSEVAMVNQVQEINEIMPGQNRAVLTLSDGRKIQLDSATSETINDGSLAINNSNGGLSYQKGTIAVMNTMTTPKGGQYHLVLSDGTKVWLNAASRITYPTSFSEKTRTVSIVGEAYFEVAKNARQPFVVKTPADQIVVLGTSFNVNAYPDERHSKTSLIEGSVMVNNVKMEPGQAYQNGKINITNIEHDVAWRSGKIIFEDKSVPQIMNEIARWYDLEIIYEQNPPDIRFFGSVKRNASLTTVVRVLEKSGIKVNVEGKKLIVR